jgi:rubrerythrin
MSNPQPELANLEIHGTTRVQFLTRATLAAGAVYGAGAVTPFVRSALAKSSDADILNFALTLEYLEAGFYTAAVKQTRGLSSDVMKLATELRDNETAHVDALRTAIKGAGAKPVTAPKVDFGNAFTSEAAFLKTANTFEDTGVSAYNGAAPMISSTDVLAAAGSIVQVEARHAALIRLARSKPPAPKAFDTASTKNEVLMAVKPFLAA